MEIPGYTIVRKLGEGGMSVVYLAVQDALKREVAVKVLRRPATDDGTVTERFLNEAQTIARLQHANIVALFDFGQTDQGEFYYCMPNLTRGDLSGFEFATDERLATILEQVCAGLSFSHRRGIVHRDIKPENILFDDDGNAQIADFGIAFSTRNGDTRLTKEGHTVGSSQHMSPEQARGEPVDARSDIYGLGVVLFELLVGRAPFDGPDDVSILLAQVTDPVPRLPPEVRHWQPIVDRALEKSPDDRFQSAEEMAAAIRTLTRDAPGGATAFLPRLSRRALLRVAAGLLLVALLALLLPDRDRSSGEQGPDTGPVVEAPAEEELAESLDSDDPSVAALQAGELLSDHDGLPSVYVPPIVVDADGRKSEIDHGFAMATREVSVGLYRDFDQETGRPNSGCRKPGDPLAAFRDFSWLYPGFPQDDDHPVVCVSSRDAERFARWLSERSGHHYRLPSQAEWRHAAWPGHESGNACETGNVAGQELDRLLRQRNFSCRDGFERTAPVASFQPNRLGVYDLEGNVGEWTSNCAPDRRRVDKLLSKLKLADRGRCDRRAVRGTSWRDGPSRAMLHHVDYVDEDKGMTTVGIRLVRDLAAEDGASATSPGPDD